MASIGHGPQAHAAAAADAVGDAQPLEELRRARQVLRDRLEGDKWALRRLLDAGLLTEADFAAARAVNSTMSGVLRQRWDEFFAMSHAERLAALAGERLNGMHWQSLFQCNPFVFLPAWQQAMRPLDERPLPSVPVGGR